MQREKGSPEKDDRFIPLARSIVDKNNKMDTFHELRAFDSIDIVVAV